MPAKRKRGGGLDKAINKPIRPKVIRPNGLAVTDQKAIEAANAEMQRLECEAIATAWHEKLQLLLHRYSLPPDDWYGLALMLAVEHEPGFRVERQLVQVSVADAGTPGFHGLIAIPEKAVGRPAAWSPERLEQLLAAVDQEKTRQALSEDLDALKRLARRQEWAPPANHRHPRDSWIKTLQNRLADAKAWRRRAQEHAAQLMQIMREAVERDNPGN